MTNTDIKPGETVDFQWFTPDGPIEVSGVRLDAPKFRKKPVEIEAMQFFGGDSGKASREIAIAWVKANGGNARPYSDAVYGECIMIVTSEGDIRADPADWIMKGVKGEFYPCKPDIFEATYDRVEGEA